MRRSVAGLPGNADRTAKIFRPISPSPGAVIAPETTVADLARQGCGVFLSCAGCMDWYLYPQAFPDHWTVKRIQCRGYCFECRQPALSRVLTPVEWRAIKEEDRAPRNLKVLIRTDLKPVAPGVMFTASAPDKAPESAPGNPHPKLTPVYVRTVADWRDRKWGVWITCENCGRSVKLNLDRLPDRATGDAIRAHSRCTRCQRRGAGKVTFTSPDILK